MHAWLLQFHRSLHFTLRLTLLITLLLRLLQTFVYIMYKPKWGFLHLPQLLYFGVLTDSEAVRLQDLPNLIETDIAINIIITVNKLMAIFRNIGA